MTSRKIRRLIVVPVLAMAAHLPGGMVRAQAIIEVPFPGASAQPQFDLSRREAISRQIALQERIRSFTGFSSRLNEFASWPSLDATYAGTIVPPYSWPFIYGEIQSRQFDRSLPQPQGHLITPTGPNGYIYQPFYSAPPPVVRRVAVPAPVAPPPLPEEIPPPPPAPVLREF